jgi:ATP-dependent Clp protease ATP-binding subunit ClpA
VPKINVYLPEELADAVRDAAIPVSAVCQQALQRAVREVTAMRASTDRLSSEPGQAATFSRFTDRARSAIDLAKQQATRRGDATVGSEHVLLGILDESENLAVRALQALDVDPADVRTELEARLSANRRQPPAPGEAADQSALDPRARRALELATTEALALGHNYVGCEHLLLGLAAEPDGIAGEVLRGMGVEHRIARRTVVTLLAGFVHARSTLASGSSGTGEPAAVAKSLERILKRLDDIESRLPG